jgi:hypothetical protein
MRAAGHISKRSSGTHFPALTPMCSLSCDARRATTLFADGAYLAAYLASRREARAYIRVRSAGADSGDDRGNSSTMTPRGAGVIGGSKTAHGKAGE